MKLPEALVVSVHSLIGEIQPGDDEANERLQYRLTDSYEKNIGNRPLSISNIQVWETQDHQL